MRMIAKLLSAVCVLISCHAQASADHSRRTAQVLDFSLRAAGPQDQSGLLSPPVQTPEAILTPAEREAGDIAADQAPPLTAPDRAFSSRIGLRLRGDFAGVSSADPSAFQTQSFDIRDHTGCASSSAHKPADFLSAKARKRRQLFYPLMQQVACRHGIPVDLFDALIIQESGYDMAARSPVGAFGLAQLMPATARDLGANRYGLMSNLDGGARYLKAQLKRFANVPLALAAYNAGPARVAARLAVPNIGETKHYVAAIVDTWQRLSQRQPLRSSLPAGFDSAVRARLAYAFERVGHANVQPTRRSADLLQF